MADKIHRLAVEGELHRPERTGQGDPNEISFSFLEDGQYYQDTSTGSLWRFDENDDAWYLLIDYDKQAQEIRNVNTLNAFQNNVGETTEDIGAVDANVGTITSIPAYTYAQLREGEEIVVIDSNDDLNYIFFTVSADTNAGEVSIPVQSETTTKMIPAGAYIQMDASIIQSYFSVDPTKLEISFDGEREATSYGKINETIIAAGTTKTFLQLSKSGVSVSEPLDFKDGQTLFLQRRTGENQLITVNGDQTFTSGFYTLNVNSFVTDFNMGSVDFTLVTYLSEPAYKSSSRLTLAEGLIELNASNISDAYNAIAGINIVTNSLSASINTSVQYDNSGAYIQLIAGPNGSEITLEANQINIDGVVTFINDQSNTTIDGDRITTGTITASQINVADLFSETIEVGNVIKSNNYVTGLSGFAIFANGEAEFRDVAVDGEIITAVGSQIDGQYVDNINAGTITVGTISADRIGANTISADKLNVNSLSAVNTNTGNLTVNGQLTVSSGGSITGSNYQFTDTGGNVAGWEIQSGLLRSASSGARIELNETKNRISIFDGVNEKVTMGYLDGLPRNNGSGNWTSSDYGFWAMAGDSLQIDGNVDYVSGDFLVEDDASVKIFDASNNEIIRLGTDAGDKGVFVYDTSGNSIARFFDAGVEIGDPTSNSYIELSNGSAFFSGGVVANSGQISGPTTVTTLYDSYGNIAKYGDVNLNGLINSEDATLVLKNVVGSIILSSYQQYIGDTNQNGSLGSLDAAYILSGTLGVTGTNVTNITDPFYTDCKMEFNVNDSFIVGTGDDRSNVTETFFRISPFNSFINVLRTDFLSSEYMYTNTIRTSAVISTLIDLDTSYKNATSNVFLGSIDAFGGVTIDNENDSAGAAAEVVDNTYGLHVIGDTRLQGQLRFDGTTSTSANTGTFGDVPAQVCGYIVISVSGTDYKIPYYND